MGSDLGCCANVIRFTLVIINGIFVILGLAVFGIGIWAVVQNSSYSFITGSSIASGGALFIVAGLITAVICVVGILGAIFKLRPLLLIYASAVVLIVILEIAAGILTFVFRGNVVDAIEDRSIMAIRDYRVAGDDPEFNEDVNTAVDAIQTAFSCCGYINASDWTTNNPEAIVLSGGTPPSCEKCTIGVDDGCTNFVFVNVTAGYNFSFNTTESGCRDGSSAAFTVLFYSVGAVGIIFGFAEVIGILLALLLCCCITSARKQEVV